MRGWTLRHVLAGPGTGKSATLNSEAVSPCVLSEHQGAHLVFYVLDAIRGKGNRLGEIDISQTMGVTDWNLSPDGSRLALVDSVKHHGHIEVFNIAERAWHEIPFETASGDPERVAWAADGDSLFVTSRTPDSSNLLRVTLTGNVQPLHRTGFKQWLDSPTPSPDGKYLAFGSQTFDSNVWMIEDF